MMAMQPDELKSLRTAAGLSQAGLGDAIGMSRKTINEMEAGAAKIELRTALAIRYVAERRGDRTAENVAAGFLGQGPAATAGTWEEVATQVFPLIVKRLEERFDLRPKGPSVKGLFSDLTGSDRAKPSR